MTFVDITAVPVFADRRAAYIAFSQRMAEVYRDHGATRITDYWQVSDPADQDDFHAAGVSYDEGQLTDLAAAVGVSDSERLVVTVTEWPSQEIRDAGTEAATWDPRVLATVHEDAVFDGSRIVANSFNVTMDLTP